MQPRKSVDYVTGSLVYDTFEVLAVISEQVAPDQVETIKANLGVVKAWLKYGHARKHGTEGAIGCPRHDVQFVLGDPVANVLDDRSVNCDECASLHRCFSYLSRLASTSDVD